MKKIEAFVRHEAFEPIHIELLDKGFPSVSVVEDKDKDLIVETILKHARSGEVGDGKIFVLPLEHAVRIRTGDTDMGAVTPVDK